MATQYIILVDDIDSGRLYTSKAAAIKEAHALGLVADTRGHGDTVVVETVKTNKRVWSHTPASTPPTVEITPLPTAPDMSEVPSECYYGCQNPVTGAAVDYVGTTIGVCSAHASRVGTSEVYPLPVVSEAQSDAPTAYDTVCVIQERPGMLSVNHYHAPGCRDIAREMKRYGQSESDVYRVAFPSVARIFAHEYGDVCSDEYEIGSPEWWDAVVDASTPAEDSGVKIMPCLDIPFGMAGEQPVISVNGRFELAPASPSEPEGEPETTHTADCASYHSDDTTGESYECDCMDFEETMTTHDYHLTVTVDETTGATVDLGWVSLTVNSAHVEDWDAVAEAYGAAHGSGKPRHGWGSIINVLSVY